MACVALSLCWCVSLCCLGVCWSLCTGARGDVKGHWGVDVVRCAGIGKGCLVPP